ncbi:calcium-binding protein [Gemmobacter serpentinus]|uniref:hypothetical protein n=1 Tax=Gemmobacter serpentinus TaxID=2652247 RepID=UPI00186576BD|nr:hypothetical protein [Gemmobacter serpentinus]
MFSMVLLGLFGLAGLMTVFDDHSDRDEPDTDEPEQPTPPDLSLVEGTEGADRLVVDQADPDATQDALRVAGHGGNDALAYLPETDTPRDVTLEGGTGDDRINLGLWPEDGFSPQIWPEGTASLSGGAGDDILVSHMAGDGVTLDGGAGADTIGAHAGNTVIMDMGDSVTFRIHSDAQEEVGPATLQGFDPMAARAALAGGNPFPPVVLEAEGITRPSELAFEQTLSEDGSTVLSTQILDGDKALLVIDYGPEGTDAPLTAEDGDLLRARYPGDSLKVSPDGHIDTDLPRDAYSMQQGGEQDDVLGPNLWGPEADMISGGQGADSIDGGAGNDTLYGSDDLAVMQDWSPMSTWESLHDDGAADTLAGGAGDDRLVLSSGDTGIGGAGADLFEVNANAPDYHHTGEISSSIGPTHIADYDPGEDRITIEVESFARQGSLQAELRETGKGLEIWVSSTFGPPADVDDPNYDQQIMPFCAVTFPPGTTVDLARVALTSSDWIR